MRSLDTCCEVLPGAGLRELPGLQTVLMAGKERRCYCVLAPPPPTLPVSAVPHQRDELGPEEEERVAVSPGLVVVPAGWT